LTPAVVLGKPARDVISWCGLLRYSSPQCAPSGMARAKRPHACSHHAAAGGSISSTGFWSARGPPNANALPPEHGKVERWRRPGRAPVGTGTTRAPMTWLPI